MIEVENVKTVNLMEVVKELVKLTGDKETERRVWKHIRTSYHGNQQFCNDTYYIFHFCDPRDIEDPNLRREMEFMEDICAEAVDYDSYDTGTLVFDVCW